MLFNKILEKIMKICVLENFSKIVLNLYQSIVKATDYITPVRSSAVLSNRNMWA